MFVIREYMNDPKDYVDNCHTVETYMRCYNNILDPINVMRLWPHVEVMDIIPHSWTIPRKGRRSINRRKWANEDAVVHSHEKSYVRRKGLVKMTCSTCGARDHNKWYHDRSDAPDADGWFRAELEPVDEYCNAVDNEWENTISKRVPRRKGSSSTHNPLGGPKWQFMPTSMATKETQTGSLTVGPAATFTNVNVPTTEINFEVIIDELRPLKRQNRRG